MSLHNSWLEQWVVPRMESLILDAFFGFDLQHVGLVHEICDSFWHHHKKGGWEQVRQASGALS